MNDFIKELYSNSLSDINSKKKLLLFGKLEQELLLILKTNSNSSYLGLTRLSWFYNQLNDCIPSNVQQLTLRKICVEYSADQRDLALQFIKSFEPVIMRTSFTSILELKKNLIIPYAQVYQAFLLSLESFTNQKRVFQYLIEARCILHFLRLQAYFISVGWNCFGEKVAFKDYCELLYNLTIEAKTLNNNYDASEKLNNTPKLWKVIECINKIYIDHYIKYIKIFGHNYPEMNQGVLRIKLAWKIIIGV